MGLLVASDAGGSWELISLLDVAVFGIAPLRFGLLELLTVNVPQSSAIFLLILYPLT